jgi:hypothetical protein
MSGHAAKMREEEETQNWRRFRLDEVSLAIEREITALHCEVLLRGESYRANETVSRSAHHSLTAADNTAAVCVMSARGGIRSSGARFHPL